MPETPAELGYRMPAEWEEHDATWISWPKDPSTFPSGILPRVEATYVKLVEALSEGEEVRILVDDTKMQKRVASLLKGDRRLSFLTLKTVDVWVRDYGQTCVRGRDVALVKWVFNAWGGKYDDLRPDDAAGERLALSTGLKVFRPGVVLEGGSIDVNGNGSLITTEQCLLNPNRNPSLGREKLEGVLAAHLGAPNVIWLKRGIEGDDTDGHVDDVARFVGPRTVAVATEPRVEDTNHRALEVNLMLLKEAADERGKPLDVLELPMPDEVAFKDGRLPASHLNFYIGNNVVLVPAFGGRSDRQALDALEDAFPAREVLGIDCRALVYGLGTIHCVTQQVPSMG